MPRGCKPQGDQALSNAERQARYRARQQAQTTTPVTRLRRPTDRRSRPQRWRDAVDMLLGLQADYADWLAALPDSLQGSATAEALEAIVYLDRKRSGGGWPKSHHIERLWVYAAIINQR